MKNLILYGGDTGKSRLDLDWMKILGKKELRITYMTYGYKYDEEELERFENKIKSNHIIYATTIESKCYPNLYKDSDVIYLSGGNTFEFLAAMRKAKVIPKLRKFVEEGGLLCGMSAGAILMSETIKMAQIPSETKDDNNIGLKDLRALNLVDFHFCPHYETWMDKELKEFSKKIYPMIIVACKDNEKIRVNIEYRESIQILKVPVISKQVIRYFKNGNKCTFK